MRTVIVFNHPNEGSYCNSILQSVTNGLHNVNHEVDLRTGSQNSTKKILVL